MSGTRDLNGLRTQVLDCIESAYDKGYKAARQDIVADANKSEYERGLNDAWKCAKKIATVDGLSIEELGKIFDTRSMNAILERFSVSEAIAKIKEYEDKQKKTDDEIHVGDEIYCRGSKYKYIVLSILDNGKIFVLSGRGLTGVFALNQVHKTGRNYPVMEILKELGNDRD